MVFFQIILLIAALVVFFLSMKMLDAAKDVAEEKVWRCRECVDGANACADLAAESLDAARKVLLLCEQCSSVATTAAKESGEDRLAVARMHTQMQDVIAKCRDLLAAANSPPVVTPVYDGMPELVQPGQDYDPT